MTDNKFNISCNVFPSFGCLGAIIAAALSYKVNASIFWAILHAFL